MKLIKLTFFFAALYLVIGCQSNEVNSNTNGNQPFSEENFHSSPITFLFSNDERIEDESSYYDALLDFQRKHPNQLSSVKIVSTTEKQLAEYYEIITYPTLLVIDEIGIIMRIEGFKETDEIFTLLENNLIDLNEETS